MQANSSPGGAEIWSAIAPNPLTGVTVTSTQSLPTGSQFLSVTTFKNAARIGATKAVSGTTNHPSADLATTGAGSWAVAVGNDYTSPASVTVGAGELNLGSYVDSGTGDAYWAQTYGPAGPAGTTVTMDSTLSGTDAVNFAAAEIVAGDPTAAPAPAPVPDPTARFRTRRPRPPRRRLPPRPPPRASVASRTRRTPATSRSSPPARVASCARSPVTTSPRTSSPPAESSPASRSRATSTSTWRTSSSSGRGSTAASG